MPPKTDSPTILGKYTLHEEIGRSGFAIVYRTTHNTLGTEAAVKVLSPGRGPHVTVTSHVTVT